MAIMVINGITLKEYLTKCLLKLSIRECMSNENFLKSTAIKTKYELEKLIKNYGLTQEYLYEYGISNNLISKTISLDNFINSRKSGNYYEKTKTNIEKFVYDKNDIINKKDMIVELMSGGYYADDSMTINEVKVLYNALIKGG